MFRRQLIYNDESTHCDHVQLIRLAENVANGLHAQQAVNPGGMPGAFPEAEGNH